MAIKVIKKDEKPRIRQEVVRKLLVDEKSRLVKRINQIDRALKEQKA